jgi:hypothetical protein
MAQGGNEKYDPQLLVASLVPPLCIMKKAQVMKKIRFLAFAAFVSSISGCGNSLTSAEAEYCGNAKSSGRVVPTRQEVVNHLDKYTTGPVSGEITPGYDIDKMTVFLSTKSLVKYANRDVAGDPMRAALTIIDGQAISLMKYLYFYGVCGEKKSGNAAKLVVKDHNNEVLFIYDLSHTDGRFQVPDTEVLTKWWEHFFSFR